MIVDDNPKWWQIRRDFWEDFCQGCWFAVLILLVLIICGAPN